MLTTKRRKLTITFASLLLVTAAIYTIFMPALWRARCGAFPMMVATSQRAIAQENQLYLDKHQSPPPSMILFMLEQDISLEHPHCWDLKDADIRIGLVSLQDLRRGHAKLADLEAEIQRLQLPDERWETFGPIAYLVRGPTDKFREDLPISIANLGDKFATMSVGYENGRVEWTARSTENIAALTEAVAEAGFPPIPDSFLSRLPQ